jgi:4-alpha-glucanotransferase
MKINFYIRYYTRFGESLSISGNINELGNEELSSAVPMQYLNHDFWCVSIQTDQRKGKLRYSYVFNTADGRQLKDSGKDRVVDLDVSDTEELDLIDHWNNPATVENVYFTSPFQDILLAANETKVKQKEPKHYTHVFRIKAPLLKKNEVVFLSGNSLALREWDINDPLLLTREGDWWQVKVNLPQESFPLQYKYGIYHQKEKKVISFEQGGNRQLHGNYSPKKLTVLHDGFLLIPSNYWHGAGAAIPVFSLKSKDSLGVGEFTDLKNLADWAKEVGLKLIQILPVNDTSATHTSADSYPYAAISAFALHPIYINIEAIAGKHDTEIVKQVRKKQKQLNELPALDYEAVMKCKLAALRTLFQSHKSAFLKDQQFLAFFETNKHWLVPYAAFCFLRDKHETVNFSNWKMHAQYDAQAIEKFVAPKSKHYDDIAFHYFIQYHLHLQLKEATQYAHKRGVVVKGDIPIGVYRFSCDAWMNPELFYMDFQAGAPPDDFAVKGQNWGFPTYNWQKMQENKFGWWKQRFAQMSNYFDAFRIDHILGFFRIWSIPVHAVEGILGYFVPAIPVYRSEFAQKAIWFDHDRYTKPYITDQVLEELFGALKDQVKDICLEEIGENRYALKEAYNTQQKAEKMLSAPGESTKKIKEGVFDLISNVIFFEAEGSDGNELHFRIAMEKTTCFRYLDWHTQQQLKDLYLDYFYRRQDNFWMQEAMKKLPALKESTNMLICGEDLGMVPASVPAVMNQLGILSLEIQRMPKAVTREFFHPNDAPYLSVVTPSTHDMSTIRGWWKEDRQKTQRFYNSELGQWGEAPEECEAWINKAIVLQHLHSPAMWSIFQLQDIFGMSETLRRENPDEERINIPADPKHYWRYRMHFTLEQLMKEKAFNEEFRSYIHASGR